MEQRKQKVGPPRRPAAHLYTLPELLDLEHQVRLLGCTRIFHFRQELLLSQEPGMKPTDVLYWTDPQRREWVAYAR